jgi:hypothetical protein
MRPPTFAQGGVGLPYSPPSIQTIPGRRGAFSIRTGPNGVLYAGPLQSNGRLGHSPKNGLQITVETNSTCQFGYHPIAVTVQSQHPAAKDRTIRIQFHAGGWYMQGRAISAARQFKLAKGKTAAVATLFVPQFQDWQMCGWTVDVDEQTDDELSVDGVNVQQQSMSFGVSALIATDNPTGIQAIDIENAINMLGNGAAAIRSVAPADTPDNWVAYSTLDVVVFDAKEFPVVAANFPRQTAALMRWVRAGGNLWVVDAGSEWRRVPAVEAALRLRRPPAANDGAPNDDADAALAERGWRFVPLGDRALAPLEGALELSGFDVAEEEPDAPTGISPIELARWRGRWLRTQVESSQPWFAVRGHGLGTVTAFRGSFSSSAASDASISMVQRSLLMPRMTSAGRHGNQPTDPNAEFNNWLIPGVGVAPIGMFQFLISLFVLTIGPLNYWWFRRTKKLPMLLATVPTVAALVTLALLAYGVLADGLGIRVRARSLTLLDQTAGEAASWSRLCYYAGINPRDGLEFSRDTILYPIDSRWAVGRYGRGANRRLEVEWTDKQRLTRGWLPSRTPRQYLSITARRSPRKLELRSSRQGMRIVNRLGTVVTHLVVCDEKGRLYWCENLADDAGCIVPAADPIDVSGKLRTLFSDNHPEFPPGADDVRYGGYYGPVLSQNLMEAQLEAINSPVVRSWSPRTYIAVTDRGIELELGVEAAEEASFHVVRGTW